jgi:hypothetical protein
MSFTSQPRKYDLGEIAYFPWSWNALNSSPITNESGTWMPASVTTPTLGTRMTAAQRSYILSVQNPSSPQVGVGIAVASPNANLADMNLCNIPSTFDNGTPPKTSTAVFLNLLHNCNPNLVLNANSIIGAVLTAEGIYYTAPGFIQAGNLNAGVSPANNTYCILVTSLPSGTGFSLFTYQGVDITSVVGRFATSSDGITWTAQSPVSYNSGQYSNTTNSSALGLFSPVYSNGVRCGMGYHTLTSSHSTIFGDRSGWPIVHVNCGARIIHIIVRSPSLDGGGEIFAEAFRTTDGFTFNGTETGAVLGNNGTVNFRFTDYPKTFFFHRNNNSCFLLYSSLYRFTTDGGVTWANATGLPSAGSSTQALEFIQTNATNRTSLLGVAVSATSSTSGALYVSTNTGQSWTARSLPVISSLTLSAIAYAGNTVIYVAPNGTAWRSSDNAATWTQISNTTLGVLANPINIVHDGFRFYMLYQGGIGALSTSTDGITWTARSIPVTSLADFTSYYNSFNRTSPPNQSSSVTYAAATNSSDVMITTTVSSITSRNILSNDGGVTWVVTSNIGATSYSTFAGQPFYFRDLIPVAPTGSTTATRGLLTGNTFIPEQHIDNLGHRFVASTASVVNTTLTGQIAYVKIG